MTEGLGLEKNSPTWTFALERVTGIEPALSAWESVPSGPVMWPDLQGGVSASDRERPLVAGVNGPLMARRTAVRPAPLTAPWSSPVFLDSCRPSGRGRRVKAREATACGLAFDSADSAETIEQRGGWQGLAWRLADRTGCSGTEGER